MDVLLYYVINYLSIRNINIITFKFTILYLSTLIHYSIYKNVIYILNNLLIQ